MKGINFFRRFSLSVILFCGFTLFINSQTAVKNLYSIMVKQGFSSWGNCSSDPDYGSADVRLIYNNSSYSRLVINTERLNQLIKFNRLFYIQGLDKNLSSIVDENGSLLNGITVHTYASDITNDHELNYSFDLSKLAIGENIEVHDASDPCNNFISNNREGYTMTTKIYIDDPVHLTNNSGVNSFCLDNQYLTLNVGNFYRYNYSVKPILQVALDNTNDWHDLSINIYPNSKLDLSYTRIAGSKADPNSHYYDWMGKNLKFRIIKTLMNGDVTSGEEVASVRFYPLGLQYSILQTRRSNCKNNVTIYVKLEDGADKGYLHLNPSDFYWNITDGVLSYHCEMQKTDEPLKYKLIPKLNNQPVDPDPFSTENTSPIEWTMQLIDLKNPGTFACEKTFTIPPKPGSISTTQIKDLFNINGTYYDVPSMNNPYALLDIDDPYDFSYLRLPYAIKDGTTVLDSIKSFPNTYNEMSQTQRDSMDALFEAEFKEMIDKPNNPYLSYFKLNMSNWLSANPDGTPIPILINSYVQLHMFSKDGSFFIYEDYDGVEDPIYGVVPQFYKANINNNGTYTVSKITSSGPQGVTVNDISPDGKTLLYSIGTCCSGITDWQVSLNEIASSGKELGLPSTCTAIGRFECSNTTNVFFDNNNIIVCDIESTTMGLYQKNITTGVLTKLYSGVANYPSLSPDRSFVTFMDNDKNLYKGVISGNSIIGVTRMCSNCYFIRNSPDGSYALVAKNSKTYKVPLNGIGTESELLLPVNLLNTSHNYALTKDSRCVISYWGTSPDYLDKGMYVSTLRGEVSTKINSKYGSGLIIDPNDRYLLYKSNSNFDSKKIYKLYLGINEATSELYPNKDIASSWYNTYKTIYKQKWLAQRLGVKIYKGIVPNTTQNLTLTDGDGCDYPFSINVKAPQNPSFSTTNLTNPSDACAKDGTAKITYLGGGIPPYVNSAGSLTNAGDYIIVSNLAYGDNNVYFNDASGNESLTYNVTIGSSTIGITSTPTTHQTCDIANGTVTINVGNVAGVKNYKLTCDAPYKTYSYSTEANSYQFTNLPSGKYIAEVESGSCYFTEANITIDEQIFTVKISDITYAKTIDGTGSAAISFENRINNVNWISGVPSVFNLSEDKDVSYSNIAPNTYQFVAQHTDVNNRDCRVSGSFTIDRPRFEAILNLAGNDDYCDAAIRLSDGNSLITPYRFRLLNSTRDVIAQGEDGNNLSTRINTVGNYIINLQYGINNVDLYTFNYPLSTLENTYTITAPKCPDGDGTIVITPSGGFDNSNILTSIDGLAYLSDNTFVVKGGEFTYYLKDEDVSYSDVSGNALTINRAIVNRFVISIPKPDPVNVGKVMPIDVSCAGSNNGTVSLGLLSGGSGNFQYRIDKDVNWRDATYITTGLVPGDYSIYLKDIGNNCPEQKVSSFNITEPVSLTFNSVSLSHPTCENENGQIIASFSGGTGTYTSYEHWFEGKMSPIINAPATIQSFTLLGQKYGDHQIKIIDSNGCVLDSLLDLRQYVNPMIKEVTVSPVKCHEGDDGIIRIDSVIGTTPVSYMHLYQNNIQRGAIYAPVKAFEGLLSGNYQMSLFDAIGCESNARYEVNVPQPTASLSVDFDPTTPVSAKYSATGVIHARVLGGNAGTKTLWLQNNRGATVDSLNANVGWSLRLDSLYAGKYMLRAIDVKGCNYQSDSLEVIEPEKALSFKVIEREDALCKAPTGKFKVLAIGGWEGIYSYKLSAGSSYGTMQSQNGLRAGSYQVSVKDRMGAEFTDAVIIYEPRDSLMVKLKDQVLPTCANNGTITVDVTGGTTPYRLVFDTQKDTTHLAEPQSTSFLNRPAGAYVLKTIDGNGCLFDMDTTLDNTQMLRILSLDPIYPSPSGGTCGLYANTRGGALPLKYEWRNSSGVVMQQQNQTLADVPTGLYSLKVTDALDCWQTSNGFLSSLADLPLTIKKKREETGLNNTDGYIVLESPLNTIKKVEWLDPKGVYHTLNLPSASSDLSVSGNLLTIIRLMGGTYTVVATDNNGQKAYLSFNIDAYQKFDFLKKVTISHVQQPGETNGSITAEVTGGVAPYRFVWSKTSAPVESLIGSSDASRGTLTGIGKGTYLVEVLDTYNNVISQEVEVLEPASKLALQVNQYAHESCRDTVDAWVELKATGGWGDYQFRHDDEKYFSNSSSRQKLVVRTHDFYLVDRLGVETRVSHLVTEPEYLRARVSLIDSVNCHGNSDGNIFFDITGGTAPYKFVYDSIPNAWVHDTVARNQPARDYRFFLSDSHDCVSLDTLTAQLRQPDELLFSLQDVTHTTCNTNNGKINVALKGGTRPYRYQWTNFDNQTVGNDSTISGLVQGALYRLEVLDKYDCRQQWTQTINPSTLPEVTTVSTTDVICYGEATGTATVTGVVPAVPYAPYSFKWSNDSTGTSANGFYAGINHVAVTDTNGCTTTKYFEVATPDTLSLRVAAFKDAHCFGYNDGYVEVEPRGGVGGYRYAWSNGETLPRASNLIKGDYLLTLTDDNDCVITHNYTIDEPEKLLVDLGDDIRICPGNSFRLDGQAFTTHQWANYTGVISNERFVSVNDECDYYLQVTNAIGCFAHDTINLSIGNDALQADFLMTSEAPKNDTLMIFELSNLELDSLRWEYEPEAFNDITGATAADYILNLKTLKNGIYNVSLWAYSGGCVANAVKQVEIIDGNDSIPNDGILGYKDPLIKSMVVAPNPNDGKFTLNIELREEADINVVVYSVDYGVKIDTRSDKNLRNYELNYQLGGLNTGVYVIMLTAENERRQVKMVIK